MTRRAIHPGEQLAEELKALTTLPASAFGESTAGEDPKPGTARRDLGVRAHSGNYRAGPRLDGARLRVAALVEVDSDEVVARGEHESDAVAGRRESLIVGAPGLRVGDVRVGTRAGVVGWLGRLSVAFLPAPRDPLPERDQLSRRRDGRRQSWPTQPRALAGSIRSAGAPGSWPVIRSTTRLRSRGGPRRPADPSGASA